MVAAAAIAAVAMSLGAGGCAQPAGEHSTRGPAQRVEVPTPRGDWKIVGHKIPGMSAMSDDEAAKWHGFVLHFEDDVAYSFADTCTTPRYRRRIVRADSLLGEGFHTTLEKLEWPDTTGQMLAITEVRCGDAAWTAPGGLLIWTAPDRITTPWEGVFFELERDSAVTP